MNTTPVRLEAHKLDWGLVQQFLAVAECGSLTRAAQQLGSSQPTLSRQIAALEAQIGTPLFERAPRGLRPTAAALALIEPARRMRLAAQALTLAAAAQEEAVGGTVRLTASEVVSAFLLPPVLAALRLQHPEIDIELVATDRVDDLLAREADIAVRMVRPDHDALIGRKIADYPMGLYAHRSYLARHGGSLELARWAEYDWIGMDRSELMLRQFQAHSFQVDREFFGFRCDNQIVGWHAMQAGLGIGAGLARVAQATPDIERVFGELPLPPLPVWLTAHRELRNTPRMRIVFDALAVALR